MSMGLLGMTTSVFYFSTWESYHTKVLYFGPISGPSEGVVISCSVLAISGLFGPQIWWTPIRSFVPGLAWLLRELSLQDLTLAHASFSGMAFLLFTTQLPTWYVSLIRLREIDQSSSLN
jgi:ethanolaminephosphotransferase